MDIDDILAAHTTHCNRLTNILNDLSTDKEKIRLLHQVVSDSLAYAGFDLQVQDFIKEHNKTFEHFNGTLESIGEALMDLGNDSEKIYQWYLESIDNFREEIKKIRKDIK